jgi:WD40 repeat protein
MPKYIEVTKEFEYLGHNDCAYTLAEAPRAGHFFSAGADGIVAEWDAHSGESVRGVMQSPVPVYALRSVPERNWLLVGRNDGGLHVVDLENLELLKSGKAHKDAIFDIRLLPGGETFVAASRDRTFSVWRLRDLVCILTAEATTDSIRRLAVNPAAAQLGIGASDNSVRIYDSDDLSRLYHLAGAHDNSVFALEYSPDGQWLLTAGRDAHLKAWDAKGGMGLVKDHVAHLQTINDIVFAPDGRHFATASMDKTIKIWRTEGFKLLKVVDFRRNQSHTSSVNRLLWLAEPDVLISASDDRRVLQWRLNFLTPAAPAGRD